MSIVELSTSDLLVASRSIEGALTGDPATGDATLRFSVQVEYRLALLDANPCAKTVLALAADKAGWGDPLPQRQARGVSVQFACGSYMAQVAEAEVVKGGTVRVHRVVRANDCGTVINPDIVRAQVEGAVIYGVTAALYGEITLKNGRVEQTNFDTYQALRIDEAPTIEVHIVQSGEAVSEKLEPQRSFRP